MKKWVTFLLAVCMVFALTACGSKPADATGDSAADRETGPAVTPLRRLGYYTYPEVFTYYKETYGKTATSGEKLDIPVYYETELLYHWGFFTLGEDSIRGAGVDIDPCFSSNLIAMPLLYEFPTVLRVQSDWSSYAVYDMDSGYRLYILIKDYLFTGYPIVVNHNKALLSLADFDSIQVGDPFEKVEEIDDVATLHKNECTVYKDFSQWPEGSQFTSVHYLTEGILMLRYRVSSAGITVSEKIFYADHIVPTADGKMTSHKLCDLDLPDGNPVDLSGKKRQYRLGGVFSQEAFANYRKQYGKATDSTEVPAVPVYTENDLLFNKENGFILTRDASADFEQDQGAAFSYDTCALKLLYELPGTALRVRPDGSSYVMYDTDTGYRLYVFFHQSNAHIAGFPILINKNKMLSYKDFAGIQVGDSVKKVAEIDDVATMHKRQIDNRDFSGNTIDHYARELENGCKVYTIHYLTDGLLVIEYSDLNMVVSNISFYADYVIPTADGQMTSHKIQDVDLP